jgi:hypothetical protein
VRDQEQERHIEPYTETYVTPVLVVRGCIEALTRGQGGAVPDTGISGSQFPP